MTGVIADLQNCYVSASQFRAKANALRDCLILDAVAFYEDNRFDQAFGATGLPTSIRKPRRHDGVTMDRSPGSTTLTDSYTT